MKASVENELVGWGTNFCGILCVPFAETLETSSGDTLLHWPLSDYPWSEGFEMEIMARAPGRRVSAIVL